MSQERRGQAWLLLTGARQTTWFLVEQVVRARGHLPVPEAGLQHPGSVARLQEDRRPLVPVLTLDLVLPPDAAAVFGHPLLRPVWESCKTIVMLRMPCAHTLSMQQAADSHIGCLSGKPTCVIDLQTCCNHGTGVEQAAESRDRAATCLPLLQGAT